MEMLEETIAPSKVGWTIGNSLVGHTYMHVFSAGKLNFFLYIYTSFGCVPHVYLIMITTPHTIYSLMWIPQYVLYIYIYMRPIPSSSIFTILVGLRYELCNLDVSHHYPFSNLNKKKIIILF